MLYTDPQAFKKLLMAQVRARGGTKAVDSKNVFHACRHAHCNSRHRSKRDNNAAGTSGQRVSRERETALVGRPGAGAATANRSGIVWFNRLREEEHSMDNVSTAPAVASVDPLVLKTFEDYAHCFETLNPSAVLSFYYYPAVLVTGQNPVRLINRIVGWGAFKIAMAVLKWRGYHHSKTVSLAVRQMRDDLAVVTGTVIRYKKRRRRTGTLRLDLHHASG